MTSISTPNIFITRNYSHIKNFFLAGKNLSLADLPKTKDTLLICGGQNKYLTHFELAYGFDNPTQQQLMLKFLDFDGKFESTFFNKDPLKDNFLNQYHNAVQSETQFSNNVAKAMMDFITNGTQGIEKIYCTFGFGENLDNWSNPCVFTLFDVKYDIGEKGLRSYTYLFSPSPGVLFRPRLVYNIDQSNYNSEFTFAESITDVTVQIEQTSDNKNNYYLIIKSLLEQYISKLTNTNIDNVIVLLPDIDKIVREKYPNYHGIPTFGDSVCFDFLRDIFGIVASRNVDIVKDLIQSTRNQKVDANKLPEPPTDAVNEAAVRVPIKMYFRMSSKYTGNKDDSLLVPLPNWYTPINKISQGIKTLFGTVDNLVVLEENDTKLLDFWSTNTRPHSKGGPWLIKDSKQRCVVVGPELFVHEYLYRLGNLSGDSKLKVQSSKYGDYLTNDVPIKEIYDESYTIGYFNAINKKKNSSSFSEKIILDELALDNLSKEIFDQSIANNQLLKLQDIPIFTNNLKNSNILSMNVNLGQTYLSQLRLAAGEDFERFVLGNFVESVNQIKYDGYSASTILDRFKTRYSKNQEPFKLKMDLINEILRNALSKVDPKIFDSKSFYDFLIGAPSKKSNAPMTDIVIEEIGVAADSLTKPLEDAWDANVNVLKIDDPNHVLRAAWKTITNLLDIEGARKGIEDRDRKRLEQTNLEEKEYEFQLKASKLRESFLKPYESLIRNFSDVLIENKENVDFLKLLLTDDIISNIAGKKSVSPEYIDTVEKSRAYKFASYLFAVNEINLDNGIIITPRISGIPQKVIAGEIFNHIAKQQIKISIKTLPFFHLSNFRTIQFKPCFLFSKRSNIQYSQSDKNNLTAEEKYEFFSGSYNITAFKHTINTRECYSEFLLQKNTAASQIT